MTQYGETDNYGVEDHIKAIFNHSKKEIIDYVIVNVGRADDELEEKYKEETSRLVSMNEKKVNELNVKIIEGDFIKINSGFIRHNSEKLAAILIETIMEKEAAI